jgi:hypothetical protein
MLIKKYFNGHIIFLFDTINYICVVLPITQKILCYQKILFVS